MTRHERSFIISGFNVKRMEITRRDIIRVEPFFIWEVRLNIP